MKTEISSEFRSVTHLRPATVQKSTASGKSLQGIRQERADVERSLPAPEFQNAETNKAGLQQSVIRLNEFVQHLNRELQFSIDETSGRTVIKVIDAETSEVIRQIPSEELLELARHLEEGKPLGFFEASA